MTATTLLMAAFSLADPLVALFTSVAVLILCWAHTGKAALVLFVVAVWILLPRDLGLFGHWVPSVFGDAHRR